MPESRPLALRIPPFIVIALHDNVLVATYALLLSNLYLLFSDSNYMFSAYTMRLESESQ